MRAVFIGGPLAGREQGITEVPKVRYEPDPGAALDPSVPEPAYRTSRYFLIMRGGPVAIYAAVANPPLTTDAALEILADALAGRPLV